MLPKRLPKEKGPANKVTKQLSFKEATEKTRKWDISDSQAQVN